METREEEIKIGGKAMFVDDYSDPKWDAETLAKAGTIHADSGRKKAAQKAAASMVTEAEEKVAAMRSVAGKMAPKPGATKETRGLANFAKEMYEENG